MNRSAASDFFAPTLRLELDFAARARRQNETRLFEFSGPA
jgi:hypothetical protein